MFVDPFVAVTEYELQVQQAEERIARLRMLEERRAAQRPAATGGARRAALLRRLLPHHGA